MIRVISCDNELSALDFQKHYRMPAVYVMDPDRSFERKYNKRGWPFLMLVDEEGTIAYRCNDLVDTDKEFMRRLQEIVRTPRKPEIQLVGDVPYRCATLANNGEVDKRLCSERFTSTACGANGEVFTASTSVKDGNSNVYLMVHKAGADPETLPVAATDADEYDATVITDPQGRAWICWTSNSMGRAYNVYLNDLAGISSGKAPVVISRSKEDAMHGRMAADGAGAIWITYYKWEKMDGISRDKEVYVRRYADGVLSPEIHVSPDDVPAYEDHTDPAIGVFNNQPVVCWSWDFHKPKGYTQEAETPTIFARLITADGAGQKAFHLSGKNIDATPALGVCGDSLWCTWDSLGRKKSLSAARINSRGTSEAAITVSKDAVNVCSPGFAFHKDMKGVLIWSQTENGRDWSLWKADYDTGRKAWGDPSKIVSQGNPRFGSCAYDSRGKLWLAYSVQREAGRQIVVE